MMSYNKKKKKKNRQPGSPCLRAEVTSNLRLHRSHFQSLNILDLG